MAITRQTLTELRRLLLAIYDDPQSIRLVAEDAGLNVSRINLGGSAVNIWHAVLSEADKVGAINTLVNVVLADYPQHTHAFRQLLGSDFTPTNTAEPPAATPLSQPSMPAPIEPVAVSQPQAPLLPIDHPRTLRLNPAEQQLLSRLLHTAKRLTLLSEFTDGRTATRVFLIRPTDAEGVDELPAVVKIGPQALIEPEWRAMQHHVLRRLPGFISIQGEPIYLAPPDGPIMGALRYSQVGDGLFAVESLAGYLARARLPDSWHVLEKRLFVQLGQLWRSTLTWKPLLFQNSYDDILPINLVVTPATGTEASGGAASIRLDGGQIAGTHTPLPTFQRDDLIQIENFVITEMTPDELTLNLPQLPNAPRTAYRLRLQGRAPGGSQVGATLPATLVRVTTTRADLLRNGAQSQLGTPTDLWQSQLSLPDTPTRHLPNPLLALPMLLTQRYEANFATIHGDLNLRNILVDTEARSTHIIDCAAARQDHAIQDLLRMERDYLTDVLAKLFFQAGLPPTTIVQLYQYVHCATRGATATSGHFSLPTELAAELRNPFIVLVTLRRAARELLAKPGHWAEYYTGLIIHLLGALKFRDLDNVPPGQQPKAIIFWGAAASVALLDAINAGQDRSCQGINWRFFDVTQGELPDVISRDLPAADAVAAPGLDLDKPELESSTPRTAELPTEADLAPVQRRLDVAAPEQATLTRAFALAVAVRQPTSPTLQLADLPATRSGQAQLDWPAAERFIRLRAEVIAPECEIVGAANYTFKLYRNLDSEIYYFSLIPKATGRLSIIVRLYQEEDMLGSTLAHTLVGEQLVSEVPVQLHSEPVTMKTLARDNRREPASTQQPIKILFLAASPLDTVHLRTDEEARAIDLALRQAANRNFEIRVHGAVRIDDLQELLLRYQPDIVHFSGHGSTENGLIVVDGTGNSVRVSGAALRQLFTVLKDNIRCIVLNACYTEAQAAGLAQVIDCVVGIEELITDEAARQFSTAFYRALGYGRSIQQAFALGRLQIELAGLGEAAALHLLTRTAAAATTSFVDGTP